MFNIKKFFSLTLIDNKIIIIFFGFKLKININLTRFSPKIQEILCKKLLGIDIRGGSSDILVVNEILFEHEYECINTNNDVKVIIDAGANIGCASIYFAKKYPNAQIYSLEPQKENFEYLVKNTKQYKNIIPINMGLWGTDSMLSVVDNNYGNYGFQTIESNNPTQNSLQSITINSLIKQFNINQIDILKMDIEGAEKNVFEHDENIDYDRINIICIELHDRMQKLCSNMLFKSICKHPEFELDYITTENLVFKKL